MSVLHVISALRKWHMLSGKYPSYWRSMAQAVSLQPLITMAQVCAQVSPCGICGAQSGTGSCFSLSSSVFVCQYHSTVTLHTHISSEEWIKGAFPWTRTTRTKTSTILCCNVNIPRCGLHQFKCTRAQVILVSRRETAHLWFVWPTRKSGRRLFLW
jgi:hypothetical protein